MQDMDCSDVNTSDIFWNGAVIFNDSFLSGFCALEWYHHSTIKRGSQSFFYTKHPLFSPANSVSSCEKNRDLSGNRNISCGKAFRRDRPPPGIPRPEKGGILPAPLLVPVPPPPSARQTVGHRLSTSLCRTSPGQVLFQTGCWAGWGTEGGRSVRFFDDFAHRTPSDTLKYKQPT